VTDELRVIMDSVRHHGEPALSIEDPIVTVVATDHSGLLSEVTGVLALHGLNVKSATVSGEDEMAVEIFTVEPARGRWPKVARLSDDLAAIMAGKLSIDAQLAERARTYQRERKFTRPNLVSTQVTVDNNASATATVVEVRAEDVVGQLHRITQALVDCRLDVISAKVSTFGAAVVDAFYVRGPNGSKVTDAQSIAALERTVKERVKEGHPEGSAG
jgi:[protein-PII] uridylyltransferase